MAVTVQHDLIARSDARRDGGLGRGQGLAPLAFFTWTKRRCIQLHLKHEPRHWPLGLRDALADTPAALGAFAALADALAALSDLALGECFDFRPPSGHRFLLGCGYGSCTMLGGRLGGFLFRHVGTMLAKRAALLNQRARFLFSSGLPALFEGANQACQMLVASSGHGFFDRVRCAVQPSRFPSRLFGKCVEHVGIAPAVHKAFAEHGDALGNPARGLQQRAPQHAAAFAKGGQRSRA